MDNNLPFTEITSPDNSALLLGYILRSHRIDEGIRFLTPGDLSQQLGIMRRPLGYVIPPHVHLPVDRTIKFTKEVLYIKSGVVRVDFYSDSKRYLLSHILNAGDFILLAQGGHGFVILEEAEIIEIKQGPYAGDNDKERFDPVDSGDVIYG